MSYKKPKRFFENSGLVDPSASYYVKLENFLTSLLELYQEYKESQDKALNSVGLVGIRNITKLIVGGVSPFNIADQVGLPPFSLKKG